MTECSSTLGSTISSGVITWDTETSDKKWKWNNETMKGQICFSLFTYLLMKEKVRLHPHALKQCLIGYQGRRLPTTEINRAVPWFSDRTAGQPLPRLRKYLWWSDTQTGWHALTQPSRCLTLQATETAGGKGRRQFLSRSRAQRRKRRRPQSQLSARYVVPAANAMPTLCQHNNDGRCGNAAQETARWNFSQSNARLSFLVFFALW